MVALAVRFDLRPGTEAAFDRLVEATTARIRADEPGTLLYLCHRVRDEPSARILYELYRDEASFRTHEEQPHVRAFLAERERSSTRRGTTKPARCSRSWSASASARARTEMLGRH